MSGVLRGFDPFMNIVVEDTVETTKVCTSNHFRNDMYNIYLQSGDKQIGLVVIRGNSIVIMEPRERIG